MSVSTASLSLILAHQYVAQLPESLHHVMLGIVGAMMAFQVGTHTTK
jgi:hypothetical protein